MTPKEKAAQLVVDNQLKVRSLDYKEAVQCAIITVEEIIKALRKGVPEVGYGTGYWSEVKQVLEQL